MTSVVETAIRSVVSKGVTALATFNRARMRAPEGPHPFLTGIHAPMTEEVTIEDLAVTGSIPPALDWRYLRIGPNPRGGIPIAGSARPRSPPPWVRRRRRAPATAISTPLTPT